jgi:FKBP-type peptidyl-prolyl cis-trans isomerase 2
VVSDRFHLKPLLVALTNATRFEVLALSQNAVRLIGASPSVATELVVDGLPSSMAEALQWDDRERQLQSHAAGRTVGGRVTAGFHGQGGRGDSRVVDIQRFLRMVDHAVVDHRGASTLPLVLAGVDELVAAYRGVTRCHHVVDGHVPGNPEQFRADELADRARPLVQPLASDQERRARESYLAGTAATVDTVEQAVIAAAAGQVASVFVPADQACWGRYREGHVVLVEHDVREPGDHDLTDVAATETLRHGGDVFVVAASDVPGGGTAAATLRY